jgi:Ca2+-binding RTX toxin-like protein
VSFGEEVPIGMNVTSPQTSKKRFRPVALALWIAPTAGSADGPLVIQGAPSGTHLRLTLSNDGQLVVNGFMASDSAGCQVIHPRTLDVCPLTGVPFIEVDTGDNGDKVEVLAPMPVPLTAHLGDGSDQFIGNAEDDTCYPEGAQRNRCYGGAGDDICITGPRNTDCVGDGGNDYAKFSTGSDGCWGDYAVGGEGDPSGDDPRTGTPGDDICVMGPGKDGAHGGPGNDKLYEGTGQGKLYGEGGNDFCDGGPGVGRSTGCEQGPGH